MTTQRTTDAGKTMGDREMLELAAKAAGHKPSGIFRRGMMEIEGPDATEWIGDFKLWNPLTDDGDAFRLAVRLRLVIQHARRYVVVMDQSATIAAHEDNKDHADQDAATRLAITRAAAEVGRAMRDAGEHQ